MTTSSTSAIGRPLPWGLATALMLALDLIGIPTPLVLVLASVIILIIVEEMTQERRQTGHWHLLHYRSIFLILLLYFSFARVYNVVFAFLGNH
ncbi:MAG: hypothetical protein AAB372_03390 [Patescibacteria group bacterium]